jgi:hypothetical protein
MQVNASRLTEEGSSTHTAKAYFILHSVSRNKVGVRELHDDSLAAANQVQIDLNAWAGGTTNR